MRKKNALELQKTNKNYITTYMIKKKKKQNYLWLTAFVFFSEWSWFLVAKTYIPSSRCCIHTVYINDLEVEQHSVKKTLKQTLLFLRQHRVLFFRTTRSTVEENGHFNVSPHFQRLSDQMMAARFGHLRQRKQKKKKIIKCCSPKALSLTKAFINFTVFLLQ